MVEHAVVFQLKANVGDVVKENMVHGLADLKEDCSKWVVAESAGPFSSTKSIFLLPTCILVLL